jgi:hypothetical protein
MGELVGQDAELLWAEPIPLLKPSYKDSVAAVFRVPSLSEVRSERLKVASMKE